MKKLIKQQQGFTIMELMIAISILAVILLLSTVVLMGISDYFTKGVNIADVQNDSRNITSQITADVEFSGTPLVVPNTNPILYGGVDVYAYCFGDIRYSYTLGFNSAPHALWRDTMTSEGSCYPLNLTQTTPSCDGDSSCPSSIPNSGSSLLASNMHLADFTIQPMTADQNIYGIEVAIALGSGQDLFETNSAGGLKTLEGNYICKNTIGQQFCATSTLCTMASRRIGDASTALVPSGTKQLCNAASS